MLRHLFQLQRRAGRRTEREGTRLAGIVRVAGFCTVVSFAFTALTVRSV